MWKTVVHFLPLASNSCCSYKLGKLFSSFPELVCTVCSLVKTAAVCCKDNCILMVDGDEPRMRRCRRTAWSGRDPVSLFYHVSEMLNVKSAKQYQKSSSWRNRQTWELFKEQDKSPGEETFSTYREKPGFLALEILYMLLP